MGKVLGIDIGITSVGYGLIESSTGEIIKAGVRLFEECEKNANEDRRNYRCLRRQLRRRHHRLERVKDLFEKYNIPADKTSTDPYQLRVNALYGKVELWELSVALLHIAKRRGTTLDMPEEEAESENELSTKEQIKKNSRLLDGKYICEIQLERMKSGKVRNHENKFRASDYIAEAEAILNNQRKYYPQLTEEFVNNYLDILQARRMYYDGPGSAKSPSPYGCVYDEFGQIKETMIDKMKGRCTFFPEEYRIAKMTYKADLFNLLNDLNNIEFKGNNLTKEDKKYLVENYIDKGIDLTPVRLKKYIVQNYDIDDDSCISGFRLDMKKNKEQLTEFKGFKLLKSYVDKNNLSPIIYEDKNLADDIIEILTSYKDIPNREIKLSEIFSGVLSEQEICTAVGVLKEDTKFKEYHSLSEKAIDTVMEELWDTNDNQMQIFSEKGFFEKKLKATKGKEIKFDDEAILSTVAKRAHREAIKVINKIREIYGELDGIVIEMAREKNSDEKKKMISKLQKEQGDFEKELRSLLDVADLSTLNLTGKQWTALKLWKQQDGKCMYSLKPINIHDIVYHFNGKFEVDHILPVSISHDDSLSNKVLCYAYENQKKGQKTPYQYFSSGNASVSYDQFKAEVVRLYRHNKKKLGYLLEERDIKYDPDIRKDFYNRNLVDTRYAARSLMTTLKDYFKVNNIDTKVYSIRGSFTDSFRKASGIKKDRDESHAHHAIDALIVASMTKVPCFSMMKKYVLNENDNVVDKDTGEVLTEDNYFDKKVLRYIGELSRYDNILFSHKVDRKVNRSIMGKQTIYGTKTKDGCDYIVNSYTDIYKLSKNDCAKLIKSLREKPDIFFIYENNKDLYNKIIDIIEEYKDEDNPFSAYYNEHGYITKKGNVPVKKLRYYGDKLGQHLDISHKYIDPKNKVVMLQNQYIRVDIYKNEKGYKMVALKYMDFLSSGNEYVISLEKYNKLKQDSGITDDYKFCFSLYKHECFAYSDKKGKYEVLFNTVSNKIKNIIEIDFIDHKKSKQGDGLKYLSTFNDMVKINTDVLGNKYYIKEENFPKLSLQT